MATTTAVQPTRRGRPTSAETAEVDERVREAAIELFLEHGFDGTSMAAVARAARITKRTLYARYPTTTHQSGSAQYSARGPTTRGAARCSICGPKRRGKMHRLL